METLTTNSHEKSGYFGAANITAPSIFYPCFYTQMCATITGLQQASPPRHVVSLRRALHALGMPWRETD
jgi:hypothetical protein